MAQIKVSDERGQVMRLNKWACRPQVDVTTLRDRLDGHIPDDALQPAVLTQVLADLQYAGYIERTQREHERIREQEATNLPMDFDYQAINGLRNEAAQTLNRYQPATLGQASRLAGVNPTDLMVVAVAMRT